MQQGVKIATSDAGGYTLQNFAVQEMCIRDSHTPVYAAQTVGLKSKLLCRVPRGKPHAIPSVSGLA